MSDIDNLLASYGAKDLRRRVEMLVEDFLYSASWPMAVKVLRDESRTDDLGMHPVKQLIVGDNIDERGFVEYDLTIDEIGVAIVQVAMMYPDTIIGQQAFSVLFHSDGAYDYDAELASAAIEVACFGEVVYG